MHLYYLLDDEGDLRDYYQFLRKLSDKFKLATWKAELILIMSYPVSVDVELGLPLVELDNILRLRYKDVNRTLARWANRFEEFEGLLIARRHQSLTRWIYQQYDMEEQ